MCGMVGYVGVQSALDAVLEGLGRLSGPPAAQGTGPTAGKQANTAADAGGSGSSGVAVLADGGLAAAGAHGGLPELREALRGRPLPAGACAVGSLAAAAGTPAARGGPEPLPGLDPSGRVAVVHEGELDNRGELRAELTARGHVLLSQTDAEVVAHLLAESFSSCVELGEAMRQVCRTLRGSFSLLAVHADQPDAVVGACRGASLAVGVGEQESYLASDPAAFGDQATREVLRLGGEAEVVVLRRDHPDGDEVRCEVTDLDGGVVRA